MSSEYKLLILNWFKEYKSDQKKFKKDITNYSDSENNPPFYPNGWLPVLESKALEKNKIIPIFAMGNELVAFRGSSGKVTLMDAYCPHLGAHFGYGGEVIGESIKCPFHGWQFNEKGQCTYAPGLNANDKPKTSIKIWESIEVNGIIFIWNHSKGEKPNWFPSVAEGFNNKFKYQGRTEHRINCHLQEIPENGADLFHLNEIHTAPSFMGHLFSKKPFYDTILKFMRWNTHWTPCLEPNKLHMANILMESKNTLFGYSLLETKVNMKHIGPAFVIIKIHLPKFNINIEVIHFIINVGPLKQRLINHVYTENNTMLKYIFGKITIYTLKKMIDRDVVIWNHKKILTKPFLAKNEPSLKRFRRWYNQFYSSNDESVLD